MIPIDTLNHWAEVWFQFMWFRSIDTLLVFLFVGGLWLILHQKTSARFGYWLFLLVLAKPVFPSLVSIPNLLGVEKRPWETSIRVEGSMWSWWYGTGTAEAGTSTSPKDSVPAPASRQAEKPGSAVSPLAMAWLVWAFITAILLLRFGIHQWMARNKMRQTQPVDLSRTTIDLIQLQKIAQVKTIVNWVYAEWTPSPLVWGILHPTIVVPSTLFQELTPNQLRWVLLHELAHIRRRDNRVSLFQSIVQIVFFFHPAVWIANVLIDQQREYACDDDALAGSKTSRRECGEGFLEAVFHAARVPDIIPATLGLINYKTIIRSRLMRILDKTRKIQTEIPFLPKVFLMVFAFVTITFSWNVAIAQMNEWIKVSETGPKPRDGHSMAYDSLRKKLVLFGGAMNPREPERYLGDTWEWDGEEWTQVAETGPSPRNGVGMIYDSKRGKVVLFGGGDSGATYGDTWEWDGTKWTWVADTGPSPRRLHAMAYNSAQGYVLVFGGVKVAFGGSADQTSETWKWDGENWSLLTTKGPSPRIYSSMVYDAARDRVVLYGGTQGPGSQEFRDTWEFDGAQWTLISREGPGYRLLFGMTYDTTREKTILFGGISQWRGGAALTLWGDTWEWDGKEWKEISTSGIQAHSDGIVYDSNRNRIVLFGGKIGGSFGAANSILSGDTWEIELAQNSGMPKSVWLNY